MYVKLSPGHLNLDLCHPHFTSTYTYEMTITLKVYDGTSKQIKNYPSSNKEIRGWEIY